MNLGVTYLDDPKLIALIQQAKKRLLLMSPGVSDAVANALSKAWKELGKDVVDIIVDVDAEVCRLGYGTVSALELLRHTATEVGGVLCHQPGVRIGLIVVDDRSIVFTPAPLLIESGRSSSKRPNAIGLDVLPDSLARDIGFGHQPGLERSIGLDPVTHDRMQAVKEQLAETPPVKFDEARRIRVFSSRFQFVELGLKNCYISRKKVRLPSYLVGLAGKKDIESRLHAQFDLISKETGKVFDSSSNMVSEDALNDMKRTIADEFLLTLKGYGTVIMRANRPRFDKEVEMLHAEVSRFQNEIRSTLQDHIDKSIETLATALLPSVTSNLPAKYSKVVGPQPLADQVKELLFNDLADAFGSAADHIEEMRVSVVFKELAYESLTDPNFLNVARKAIPALETYLEEFDALRTTPEDGQ